ncbi:LamG-like jellyroll fold domain-containing protein [Paenibacillus campi]|uniref:LamG-like jellyroll fold domain-containing protein n=1 Tax=Paenibacillus campi TaxID=3106031 RepID=UPI002AFFDC77|nr:LamG-like jellyroll fold domain-containing protein [Paenibacillus sp. SGZ-1014]
MTSRFRNKASKTVIAATLVIPMLLPSAPIFAAAPNGVAAPLLANQVANADNVKTVALSSLSTNNSHTTMLAALGSAASVETASTSVPVYQEASVHDPSVIKVGDEFYIFGSHLAAAKSSDLMNWSMISSGVADGNPLIPNVTTELKDALSWAQTNTLWAADVIQLADGKFYMYYNACKGDSPRSAMGIAVADHIEGPYRDQGIFLKSGMWNQASADGTIYDARIHPNTVDPDVFFDKEGKLWMVYGSYSGGIFVMQMDPVTGKPLPQQGYGKKLIGGNHSRIEGAYMLYSPQTDDYYLFLSFGGLDATGGYNLRVVRSKTPDGPFYDAAGNDMTNVKSDPSKPLFDDASIEPYGVKIIGNYQFERQIGDPGTGTGAGAVSPGHNSAYYDEQTGRYFLIFHSRFPGRGEQHQVRTHEMFMNADGWLTVAPYRYAGEQNPQAKVSANEIPGDYQWIIQDKHISADLHKAVSVTLTADGTITGAVTGTWQLQDNNTARITVGKTAYTGVFLHEINADSGKTVLTLTALSKDGTSVWGSQREVQKDKQLVSAVDQDLSLGDTDRIFYDLNLPLTGTRGVQISWHSNKPEIISDTGKVTRPAAGEGDARVTLIATITKNGAKKHKNFKVNVLEQAQGPLLSQYTFNESSGMTVTDSTYNHYDGTLIDGVTRDVYGKSGAGITLNGVDGYVQLPGTITDAEDYTFASWVKWDGGAAWQRIFDFGNGMNGFMFLTPFQGRGVQFTIHQNNTDQSIVTSSALPTGQWVYVAVTLSGNTGKLYINGKLAGSNEGITLNPHDLMTREAYLGKSRFAADAYLKGSLDEVNIYNRALSEQEIGELAK